MANPGAISRQRFCLSGSFEVDGGEMFKHACKTGLEGVGLGFPFVQHIGACRA
jgi:hypothetical protein